MKRLIKTCLLSGMVLLLISNEIHAQRAIDFLQMQGNSEELFLRIISESDAVSAGNGVVKIQLPDGSTGAADLVATSDPDASELRIETPYGTRAWREETFYAKAYGGSTNDQFSSITQATNGGITAIGSTSLGANGLDFFLVQTHEDGTLNWAQAMGVSLCGGYEIITTNTGGYFTTGFYKPGYYSHAYNYHMNSSGSVIFQGAYGNLSYSQVNNGCIQASDNHFVTIGRTTTASNSSDFFVNKIDRSTGAIIWSKIIGDASYEYGEAIIQRADGGYVGVGNKRTAINTYNIYMLFMDSNGNEELSLSIGDDGDEYGEDIIIASDGNYVIAGSTNSIGAGSSDFYITKRDLNGNEIWSSAIGGSSDDFSQALAETQDGGFVLTGGTYSYGAGACDMWLVKTDSLGNPEWSWVFGGTSTDLGSDLVIDDNGCIYCCGYTDSFSVNPPWDDGMIVKFSPDGKTCLGSQITPGSDNMSIDGFTATRIDHFNVDRTSLPTKRIKAHCLPFKQDLEQPTPSGKGEISITPTVTTICN